MFRFHVLIQFRLVMMSPIVHAITASKTAVCRQGLVSTRDTSQQISKEFKKAKEISKIKNGEEDLPIEEIEKYWSQIPEFLNQENPPSKEDLRAIREAIDNPEEFIRGPSVSNKEIVQKVKEFIKGSRKQTLEFMKFNFQFEGHYYFFGNGMEAFREIAKNVLAGTEAESHIHEFRISKQLFRHRNFETEIKRYFEALQWGPAFPGHIVLIDSVTTQGNNSTLLRIADKLVSFLESKGMSKLEATQKVIPIAVTEDGTLIGDFQVSSESNNLVSDFYQQSQKFVQLHKSDSELVRPFVFDNSLSSGGITITFRNFPKWHIEYKFEDFNDDGIPVTNRNPFQSLWDEKLYSMSGYRATIRERLSYLAVYKMVYDYYESAKKSDEYQTLIREINKKVNSRKSG